MRTIKIPIPDINWQALAAALIVGFGGGWLIGCLLFGVCFAADWGF